jgi:DNA repair exonuclease SbcCD nuclease subunit
MNILVVGDIHAEPHDLEDCERLFDLTHRTAEERAVDAILYLGDQNNNHDTTSVTVLAFYRRRFAALRRWKQFAIKGNHDQADPKKSFPHAMSAYEDLVTVVDRPMIIAPGVGAMPYYFDSAELVREENALAESMVAPPLNYLYCHATILGARYENGFFAKDAVDASLLKTPKIGCGHIHSPQKIGDRVTYFGSPRWRTLGDASVKKRAIWVVRHSDTGALVSMSAVSTVGTCRRILRMEDRPDAPMEHAEHGDIDRLHVKVYGTPARIRERAELLKAKYRHVVIQGVPERVRAPEVRESEGVVKGFERFADAFVPPTGRP